MNKKHDKAGHSSQVSEKGYVFYFVTILLLITVTLLGVIFRYTAHVRVSVSHAQQLQQARLLAQSGIARTEFFLNGGDAHDIKWETDSFVEVIPQYGDIRIACKPFGLFSRVVSTGTRIHKSVTREGILGRTPPEILKPVLTLSGSTRGLVLAENTFINGDVVLSFGNVVSGEEKSSIAGSENWTLRRSSPEFPFDPKIIDTLIGSSLRLLDTAQKMSNVIWGSLVLNEENRALLQQPTLTVTGNCSIENISIKGKTIISQGLISIGQNAKCKGSVFISDSLICTQGQSEQCFFFSNKKAILKAGVHNSQFIANDSIFIGKDIHGGLATIWLSKKHVKHDTVQKGGLIFESRGEFMGCAIAYLDSLQYYQNKLRGPGIVFGDRSRFVGFLLSNGDIELPPIEIQGHIWAQSVSGVRKDLKYLHWLFSVNLRPLEKKVLFPLIGAQPLKTVLFESL